MAKPYREPSAPPKEAKERRPAFAEDFPRVAELDLLVAAFVDGDYARVRTEAPKLAASAEDDEVKRAARLLRSRVEADPAAVWIIVLTAVLLAVLTGYWIWRGHPKEGSSPAPPPPTVEHVR